MKKKAITLYTYKKKKMEEDIHLAAQISHQKAYLYRRAGDTFCEGISERNRQKFFCFWFSNEQLSRKNGKSRAINI